MVAAFGVGFHHSDVLAVLDDRVALFEVRQRHLVADGNIVMKRRDTGTKEIIPQTEAVAKLAATLEAMQKDLLASATRRMKENTVLANSIEEVEEILNDVTAERGGGKFVMAHLKDDPEVDARVKSFKASVRNMPLTDEFDGPGKCIVTGESVEHRVVVAKAY